MKAKRSIGIYGASDDLVTIEVDGEAYDELGSNESFTFTADGKSLHVYVAHDGRLGWQITTRIDDPDEEGDLPFSVSLVQHKYSPKLVVTPKGLPVTFLWHTTDENGDERTKTGTIGRSSPGSSAAGNEQKGKERR